MQKVCGPLCAARKAKADRLEKERAERENFKRRKETIKPVSEWEEECRRIVQKIARIRDRKYGCISCDKPADWQGQWHGSHFKSVGSSSALQFHLWNINRACWVCNKIFSGRIDAYERGLIDRYGRERVDWLEANRYAVVKRSGAAYIDYLKRFKAVMGKRLRRMEKRMKEQE
jgi:hypothetical protein